MISKNPKVIMTSDELVRRLKILASRKTFYKNKYPYNLCRINEDGRTSADCVNLIKAVLNGYDVNKTTVGYYQSDLSNTGDCTESELICQCSDVSEDFSALDNRPRILYMYSPQRHIGCYLGQEVVVNGKICNVIECTTSFGGGIVYSYVDKDGTRRKYKGSVKNCKWLKHGLPDKWVSNAPQGSNSNEKPKADYSKYPVLKKGDTGKYVKIMQQLLVDKGYDPKGVDGIFGNGCLACVKKYQKENTDVNGKKLVVDGMVGQKTWGSLYK